MTIYLLNFDPPASATQGGMTNEHKYINPNVEISFDVTSDGAPIAQSDINVEFEAPPGSVADNAIIAGVAQAGFNVNITSTSVGGNPGFHVSIIASDPMSGTTVQTHIDIDGTLFRGYFSTADWPGDISDVKPVVGTPVDIDPEPSVGFSFSGREFQLLFQLNDVNEPAVTNRVPVAGSNTAERDTTVQFSVHDYGVVGINITTLQAYVTASPFSTENLVVNGGSFVYPNTGTITQETVDGFDAFTIVVDTHTSYPFDQEITVRVVVSDLAEDPSAVNTVDSSYTFNIKPHVDIGGPEASPTQPPTGLGLDSCIEFDWLDDPGGPGPDWDTLDITLRRETTVACITSIRDDIAVVGGVAAPGYTVYRTPIVVGIQIGFHVIVCPDTPFNELEIVTMIVTGDDENGLSTSSSFSVSTAETTAPTILNLDPHDGETDVDQLSSIYFEMHDSAGSGVDINNFSVNVDDAEAVIDGIVQPGWTLGIINDRIIDQFGLNFDGYEFTLTRDTPFTPGRHIGVDIDGYDGYGNRAVKIYSFVAAADTDPPVISILPEDGATQMNRDQNVVVDITDILGQDITGADIWVKGVQAVLNGVGVAPFDVYTEDIPDGYRYIIDSEYDFGFNELVRVTAVGRDLYGNSTELSSSFTTYNDPSGPSITGVSPGDGQEEVSLSPSIAMTIRDGYDVTFELTEITVNGESAVKNGLAQSGYTMGWSRISGGVLGVDPGDGYNISVSRIEGFEYSQTIVVNVKAYTRGQNSLTEQDITFYTIDPRPPLVDFVPAHGDTDVDFDTNVLFEIFSDGYGVDIDTLDITLDDFPIITDGVVQAPDYIGTITEVIADEYYVGSVDPRFVLPANASHTIRASVQESTSDNLSSVVISFLTGNGPENPETLYIGGADGVISVPTGEIDGYTEPTELFDGYYVHDLSSKVLNEINRLAVATRDHGTFVYTINYAWPTTFYSIGDEITKVHISDLNGGTLYLANRTRERVDVYYNILWDDVGRSTPDVYYAAVDEAEGFDGYAVEGIRDGYFTDMVVTEGTSSADSDSSTIFLGTPYGIFRVDTDESVPGSTEIHGVLSSYGIPGGDFTHDILGGNTNMVEAIDVNTRLNHMYVATRGNSEDDVNALTYIDLSTNTRSGVLLEAQLIHRLINDIDFQD